MGKNKLQTVKIMFPPDDLGIIHQVSAGLWSINEVGPTGTSGRIAMNSESDR